MERRDVHPESWLWETAEGHQWLTRLVVATLYTFGLKRGVGVDTMSAFFARLHLDTQVGCSPCALRQVMQALVETAGKTAETWEQDASAAGEVREIIGGVDETFLERMMVVFQDLPTGYLVLEDMADDRTFTTWKTWVDERLKALGAEVLYLVSDRAKAFMQLAEKGVECLSMPDCFHVVHAIVKSYALAMGQRLRQAQKELKQAQEALARRQGLPHADHDAPEAPALVEARQAAVTRGEEAHQTYRGHVETLSCTLHPFRMADAAPQTSAQVASQLHTAVEAIEALAQRYQLPARHDAMTKVRKQVPALAALVDCWWQGVQQALEPCLPPPCGSVGCTSACSRSCIGNTTRPTPVARDGKPSCDRPWRRCKPHCIRMPSPRSWPPECWRRGKRGPPSGRRPCSVHHRPWKDGMALCRKCIRTIGACPGADTRCGRLYTTLIVALRMAQRQRLDFSGRHFRIALKRFYPISRPCLSLEDENTRWRYVIEVMKVSRFKWIPVASEAF